MKVASSWFVLSLALTAADAAGQPDDAAIAPSTSSGCDLTNLQRSPPWSVAAQANVAAAVGQANTCLGQRDAACAETALTSVQALTLSDDEQALLAVPRAELAMLRGDSATAEEVYRATLALPAIGESLRREITRRLAFVLSTRGEFAEVLRLFDPTKCGGWTADALALRAVAYESLGAGTFAKENYEAAIRLYELEGRAVPAVFQARYETLLAADAPNVVEGPDVVPLFRANPQYPEGAMRRGLEGWVQLEFDITDTGTVENVRAVASLEKIFEQPAIAALQRWRYVPKFENGLPVGRSSVRTVITFCLDACDRRTTPPPREPDGRDPAP